ncbi:MAG: hypothetical protein LAT84_09175 [Balneolia bacterium]|nr:hypothetical protein [Balneolia bacterium]
MTSISAKTLASFTLIITALIFLSACDEDTFPGPDFSAVPDPVSIAGITPDTLSNNILIYTVSEGNSNLSGLNQRDLALMRFSIWRDAGRGNVRDSSYEGQFMEPAFVDIQRRQIGNNVNIFTGPYFGFITNGMIAGTSENNYEDGEFRVALVPPSVTGLSDTLRYDLELFQILD